MLVLTRKPSETITIGENIRVMVLSVGRGQVRIGIEAPRDVPVYRQELLPVGHQVASTAHTAQETPQCQH